MFFIATFATRSTELWLMPTNAPRKATQPRHNTLIILKPEDSIAQCWGESRGLKPVELAKEAAAQTHHDEEEEEEEEGQGEKEGAKIQI